MTVDWSEPARDRLADMWVAATSEVERELIERTVLAIVADLARDPFDLGESRANSRQRYWFPRPLAVAFEILPGKVQVTHVKWAKRRDGGSAS